MSKKILRSQNGSIAITMVISAVLILAPLMINFSYDTNVNKLKVYNMEDRVKAKLTAESGLQFAMARLRLYQEAFNYLQKNDSAKDIVKPETLDSLWNFPFIYPIPVTKNMNRVQKEVIEEFANDTILDGSMNLTINNISNKMNLNLIRLSLIETIQKRKGEDPPQENEEDKKYNVENQLAQILTNAIESKSETDDSFNARFYGMEIEPLIAELKFAMSDPNSIEDAAGADTAFSEINLTPKRAPFSSPSELNTLPSWPDEIIELIRNEFTIHGAIMIDLNKITDKLFKILIPDVTEEDIKEFFEYKNDPEDPKHFNALDDFKKYVVNIGNIMNEADFDERFNKFKAQGLNFGPTPTLFTVKSSATVGRATFNLTAYVVIPAQPMPKAESTVQRSATKDTDGDGQKDNVDDDMDGDGIPNDQDEDMDGDGKKDKTQEKEQKTLLLSPRIVEIIIG